MRTRPWYIQTLVGYKNVFFILDDSAHMKSELNDIKKAMTFTVGTVHYVDNFGIVINYYMQKYLYKFYQDYFKQYNQSNY